MTFPQLTTYSTSYSGILTCKCIWHVHFTIPCLYNSTTV